MKGQAFDPSEIDVECFEVERKKRTSDEIDRFIPFSEWKRRKLIDEPDTETWSPEDWKSNWEQLKTDPEYNFIHVRGQWCIGVFEGVELRAGEERAHELRVGRTAQASNAAHLTDLMNEGQEQLARFARASSSIAPVVQARAAETEAHTPLEQEVSSRIHPTRYIAGLQHEMAAAQSKELDVFDETTVVPPQAPANGKASPAKKVRSESVLKLELESNLAHQRATLIGFLNEKREKLDALVEEVNEANKNKLNETQQGELNALVTAGRIAWSDLQKKTEEAIESMPKDVPSEEQYKSHVTSMQETVKTFKMAKHFNSESTKYVAAVKEIKDRMAALLKLNDAMQKHMITQSAQQLRGQQPQGPRKEHNVVKSLRLVVQSKGDHTKFMGSGHSSLIKDYFDATLTGAVVRTNPGMFKVAVVDPITASEYFKSHTDWMKDHLSKTSMASANADIVSAKAAKEIRKILVSHIDAKCFHKLAGEDCVNEAFAIQLSSSTKEAASVLLTPRCLPECRLHLKGVEVISGVRIASVEGATLTEKKNTVSSMDAENWLKLCEASGFAMAVTEGSLVMLPPGLIVVTFVWGESDSHAVRWSFIPPDTEGGGQHELAAKTMRMMLNEFPVDENNVAFKILNLLEHD